MSITSLSLVIITQFLEKLETLPALNCLHFVLNKSIIHLIFPSNYLPLENLVLFSFGKMFSSLSDCYDAGTDTCWSFSVQYVAGKGETLLRLPKKNFCSFGFCSVSICFLKSSLLHCPQRV